MTLEKARLERMCNKTWGRENESRQGKLKGERVCRLTGEVASKE